jgi:hypothetical protein
LNIVQISGDIQSISLVVSSPSLPFITPQKFVAIGEKRTLSQPRSSLSIYVHTHQSFRQTAFKTAERLAWQNGANDTNDPKQTYAPCELKK